MTIFKYFLVTVFTILVSSLYIYKDLVILKVMYSKIFSLLMYTFVNSWKFIVAVLIIDFLFFIYLKFKPSQPSF